MYVLMVNYTHILVQELLHWNNFSKRSSPQPSCMYSTQRYLSERVSGFQGNHTENNEGRKNREGAHRA